MGEWVRDDAGQPLKTTDALLDWGYALLLENQQLREELRITMEVAIAR